MTFRPDRRVPALWLFLAAMNVALACGRFHKHGLEDGFAWIQAVLWSTILVAWILALNKSWQFTEHCLVMRRSLLPNRQVPYEAICSVGWNAQRNISLTLGGQPVFRGTETVVVMVRDTPGFLSEMERHVQPHVLHV